MLVGPAVRRVAILGGLRIPFARAYTAYASASNQDLLTAVLRAVVERFKLQGERLGDVAAGAVIKHTKDYNLVRESVLSSGLDPQTPGLDLQRACGTGLEAALDIGNKIALGQIEAGIAGGVDSISDAPIVYPRSYQQLLLRSYRGRTPWQRVAPWFDLRPKDFRPVTPAVVEPRTGLSMGQSTEIMAKRWQISRTEQDLLAYDSHLKAAAAWRSGFYDDLVIEYLGLRSDNNVRPDTSLDKLGKLSPSFVADGTLTAGNSTPLTDGASAVLLATPEWAAKRNLPVLAYKRQGRVVDGARVRGAGDAARCRDHAAGFRLLRDPRGLCRPGALHAQGLGVGRLLPPCAGLAGAAGRHRSQQAERQRWQRRTGASLCRHRHTHRRNAREAAGGGRERQAWAGVGVHRRGHGRDGHHRALGRRDPAHRRDQRDSSSTRARCSAVMRSRGVTSAPRSA